MEAGTCVISPRIVALPVFDPDAYDLGRLGGQEEVRVTKVLGFFLQDMIGNDVDGYTMLYPALANGTNLDQTVSWLRTVVLVR